MMGFSTALEAFRSVNRILDRNAYAWRLVSLDGAPVRASSGIPFPTEPLAAVVAECDVLVVCGGLRMEFRNEREIFRALRAASRSGVVIGALSTASYLLAKAGLLEGYRCTIHWENLPAFREAFPELECTGNLYEIDRDRITCSGGTAALDMVLHLVAETHGDEVAQRVANQFHHERIRDRREGQRGGRLVHFSTLPHSVQEAINVMMANIEEPLTIPEIAEHVKLSPRQLERLFVQHEGLTPARYYMGVRIERARELILYSNHSAIEIAIACGFASSSYFAQWFKRIQGVSPADLRARSRIGMPKGRARDG